jgi:class 3 adenylate cyclase
MDFKSHKAVIVLADIGGYTRFIKFHSMALVHAEKIITDLLETVIDAAEYPLTLNKLEGDAAMFYALADSDAAGVVQSALRQVSGFFAAFAAKQASLMGVTLCTCSACQGIGDLRVKAIVHFGEIVLKQVRTFEELAGETVIVAHRLLKNSVAKDQYILVTEAVERLSGGLLGTGTPAVEPCEGIGEVSTVSYDPPTTPLPPVVRASWLAKGFQLVRLQAHLMAKRMRIGSSQRFPKLAGL